MRQLGVGTAALLVAIAIGACGGSTKTVTVVKQIQTIVKTATTSTSTGAAPASTRFTMPVTGSATACVIEGQGVLAQFHSADYNVDPACSTEVKLQARNGQLWKWAQGYSSGAMPAGYQIACKLRTASNQAVVWIYGASGGSSGDGLCTGLINAGWVEGAS